MTINYDYLASHPVLIRNGNTCPMITSAPPVTRHCRRNSNSSILIFLWQWDTSSWGIFSFILNFHNASSNIVVISFSLRYSSSKWAILARIQRKIPKLSPLYSKLAVWIMFLMVTPNSKCKSLHKVCHTTHDQKLHSFSKSWMEWDMRRLCKHFKQVLPINWLLREMYLFHTK